MSLPKVQDTNFATLGTRMPCQTPSTQESVLLNIAFALKELDRWLYSTAWVNDDLSTFEYTVGSNGSTLEDIRYENKLFVSALRPPYLTVSSPADRHH